MLLQTNKQTKIFNTRCRGRKKKKPRIIDPVLGRMRSISKRQQRDIWAWRSALQTFLSNSHYSTFFSYKQDDLTYLC